MVLDIGREALKEKQTMEYASLKAYGFSPAKAGEIVLDARRGSLYAQMFIRLALADHPA